MQKLENYIPKLRNKEKIKDIDDKLINTELKIDKIESKRVIIKNCIKEMENKMFKLREKSINHPNNQKIRDEIEKTEDKLREGIKIRKDLNDKIFRKEIALIKLKQEKKEQIKIGLIDYKDEIKLRYEKIQHEINKHNKNNIDELKELKEELEHINLLINV